MNKQPTLLEAQKELLAATFSQAQAYTQIIVAAGYAGFFAIWSQMAPELTPATRLWAALLVSVSVAGFVGWEIFGMVHRSRSMLGVAQAVNTPALYEQLILEHRAKEATRAARLVRVWVSVLAFVAGTAFLGLAVLLSAFVHGLWLTYHGT